MIEDQETYDSILKILKLSPRGLTITDISRRIKRDRNYTSKQLEILKAEGKVQTRHMGSARVYWLSQRVPLSAFLCFTRNMILILDHDMNIVQVNEQYLKLAKVQKESLIGHNILDNGFPVVSNPEALNIICSTGKEQIITDIRIFNENDECFYKMEVIPTLFEQGEKGLTIVLEDITEKKCHLKNMEFLARTALEFVDLPLDADMFWYIADRLLELLPLNSKRCWIMSYDEMKRKTVMKAVSPPSFREEASFLTGGKDLVGMELPMLEFFSRKMQNETPSTIKEMREFRLKPLFNDEEISFYDFCFHLFPKEVCKQFLLMNNIGKICVTGLVWQKQVFGIVGICMVPDDILENKQAIESFLRQASIAIARRLTEKQLSISERKFEGIIEGILIPAITIDHIGNILHINGKFTQEFGYLKDDINSLDELFEKGFNNIEYIAKDIISPAPGKSVHPDLPNGEFSVRCRDKTEKIAFIRQITLVDGTRVCLFEGQK